jgi:hypothetical protein
MEESRDQFGSWEEASSVGNKVLFSFLRRAHYSDKIPRKAPLDIKIPRKAPLDMREHRHRGGAVRQG